MNIDNPFNDDLFSSDPELEAMARQFRQTLKEEQLEIEEIATEEFESSVDLAFAFLELMWSGSQTRVSVGDAFFEGTVNHVGKDIVQMSTRPGTNVDIQIPFIDNVFVVERFQGKGKSIMQRDPRTFIARMRELASMPMQEIELGTNSTSSAITGILTLVRSDHLVLTNKEKKQWLVPLTNIGYCLTRAKFR